MVESAEEDEQGVKGTEDCRAERGVCPRVGLGLQEQLWV